MHHIVDHGSQSDRLSRFAANGLRVSGAGRLWLAVIILTGIWLVGLPALDHWDWMRERSRRLEDAGVQTDAMFYTELDWDPPVGAHFP